MLYHTFKLLSKTDLSIMIGELMNCPDWVDGATSAAGGAKLVKKNIQLSPIVDIHKVLDARVVELLMNEKSVLNTYIYPKKIINVLFSRSSAGMCYGNHVDAAHTALGRRDYSFTLFLTNPSEYEGGELILNVPPEQKAIKLDAGSIIIYPTKYLHEVRQVTKGERMVCVGWIESYIKKDDEREMLGYIRAAMAHIGNNDNSKSIIALNIAYERLKKYFGD